MTETMDLGTLMITLEDGKTRSFLLRATVRQGDHVLEVRDAETEGHEVWTIFKLGSPPIAISIVATNTHEADPGARVFADGDLAHGALNYP